MTQPPAFALQRLDLGPDVVLIECHVHRPWIALVREHPPSRDRTVERYNFEDHTFVPLARYEDAVTDLVWAGDDVAVVVRTAPPSVAIVDASGNGLLLDTALSEETQGCGLYVRRGVLHATARLDSKASNEAGARREHHCWSRHDGSWVHASQGEETTHNVTWPSPQGDRVLRLASEGDPPMIYLESVSGGRCERIRLHPDDPFYECNPEVVWTGANAAAMLRWYIDMSSICLDRIHLDPLHIESFKMEFEGRDVLGAVSMSPDEQHLAFVTTDLYAFVPHLHLVDLVTGEASVRAIQPGVESLQVWDVCWVDANTLVLRTTLLDENGAGAHFLSVWLLDVDTIETRPIPGLLWTLPSLPGKTCGRVLVESREAMKPTWFLTDDLRRAD